MKICRIETWPINIPYTHVERSTLVNRAGVSDIVVKITADNGLIGWGESSRVADVFTIHAAINAMKPIALNRSPWDKEAICRDVYIAGGWQFQEMTANLAYAGIDMAMWDLCAKSAGKPLYQLFGGAMRDSVDYFYYISYDKDLEVVRSQCADGVAKGFSVFYVKVGIDEALEERMLGVIREAIGPNRKLRIDANQGWEPVVARRLILRWHEMFTIDFVEAPTRIEPLQLTEQLRQETPVPICANEGPWRVEGAHRILESRAVDYLCFSPYWVGSICRFLYLSQLAHHHGIQIVKHTHGEFGIAAAVCQHLLLAIPNAADGHQQVAHFMQGDILTAEIPIRNAPTWKMIGDKPGFGYDVDEAAVMRYHQDFKENGPYSICGDKFPIKSR